MNTIFRNCKKKVYMCVYSKKFHTLSQICSFSFPLANKRWYSTTSFIWISFNQNPDELKWQTGIDAFSNMRRKDQIFNLGCSTRWGIYTSWSLHHDTAIRKQCEKVLCKISASWKNEFIFKITSFIVLLFT